MDDENFYEHDYDDEPKHVIGRCEDCVWVEDCPDASGGEGCDDFTEVN